MPPTPFLDVRTVDSSRFEVTHEQLYALLPQRYEFAQLDGIVSLDRQAGIAVGLRKVRSDEWWCRGHMPGLPIFPGVLMMECGAQLSAYVQKALHPESEGFMAFGGVDGAKFRGSVIPPAEVILVAKAVEARSRRFVCDVQSFCKGEIVFEGRITGMPYKA